MDYMKNSTGYILHIKVNVSVSLFWQLFTADLNQIRHVASSHPPHDQNHVFAEGMHMTPPAMAASIVGMAVTSVSQYAAWK